MPGQFTIRLAIPDDAGTIADHRARMFHEMGDIPADAVEELRAKSRDRLGGLIADGEYVGWLAVAEKDPNVVAGGAGIQLRRVLPHPLTKGKQWLGIAEGRQAILLNVFTEPAWRRQGVAVRLVQQVIAWTRAERLDSLVLHASAAARVLYQRLGFIATNEMRFNWE